MGQKFRKTGIDIMGDVHWGTHFCQFYKSKEDLINILVPYFKAGLENNEFCMWVTSESLGEKEAEKAMRKAVPNFERYLKRGQIEIVPHSQWYLKDGAFNLQRVLKAWIDKLNQALAKGYDGIRLTGNAAWLEKRDWRSFTDYEEEINSVIGKYRMVAICSYCLDRCGAVEIIDVVNHHQFALISREGEWELMESSERKQAEERIREYAEKLAVRNEQLRVETEKTKESDRLKSEFLANMSHEIRTPLTAIKGAAYLLDKGSLSEEQKKLCSIIGQEVRLKRLADSKIRISVTDTGIGIPQEKLCMVFTKFYQVDGTTTRKYRGTGLGLTIVKELVNLLGGEIKVKSKPKKGSTFSFVFPYRLAKQKVAQDLAKLKPETGEKARKDVHILIAEDDEFGYYIIKRFLDDYTISRAKDGKDALEKIKKKRYDLVLMDIQMPKMNGLEATRKIREKDPNLPIIALTAKAMKGDEEMCLETGCTDYISKPVAPDELIAKVNQYTTARLVRELESFPARVLDMEALLKTSGQDTNLAQETLKMFLEYLPQQLFKIKKSITDKNPEELERFSHSLKGAAKSVGASIIAELAFSLEKMAGSSSMDEAKATFSRLEKEKERFAEAAKKMPTVSPQPSANFF